MPKVVWSDEDAAIAVGIKKSFPEAKHHLCIWHLWKNFYKHLRSLFVGKENEWNHLQHIFWRLSKTSDASYEEHILKDYDMMEDFIKKHASGNEGIKADLTRYLGRLRKNMKQWGGVYIYQQFNCGIHSSQRVEAINSSVASICSKRMTLEVIVGKLIDIDSQQNMRAMMQYEKELVSSSVGKTPPPVFLAELTAGLTSYAKLLASSQVSQILQYSKKKIEISSTDDVPLCELVYEVTRFKVDQLKNAINGNEGDRIKAELIVDLGLACTRIVTHRTSLLHCTCQYSKSYGMFCRHQLVVLFDVGIENWEVLKKCIHRRWYLDNSTSQTIPPANNDNEDNNTVVIEKPMTKKERLKEFNANTKVLKDLCTNDPKSFNESMKVVRDLIANLQLQVSNDASNSSVLVANPDVVVGGRQKRHEGSIPYAPGTKKNKVQGKQAKQKKKKLDKEKAKKVYGV